MSRAVVWLVLLAAPAALGQTTGPAADDFNARLTAVDQRAAQIHDLTADFSQSKFTPMLRKPLVSAGRVRVCGAIMRWDTDRPAPTVMLITPQEMRLYYSQQAELEIYPIQGRLAELAASPLPRLAVLRRHFTFAELPASALGAPADARDYLALLLTPISAELRRHVQEIRVLLDFQGGYIVKAQMTDADGDRTVIGFTGIRINTGVENLDLVVPKETRVSHPLEGLSAPAPPPAPEQ